MKIGTKSLLFGAHAIWLHPFMVAIAWWRLFGFPWNLKLWVVFFLHDIGYWGSPDMDGPFGSLHPIRGATIVGKLFGPYWESFSLRHSLDMANRLDQPVSDLYWPDKLATAMVPWWVYIPMIRATGEIAEYKSAVKHINQTGWVDQSRSWKSDIGWFKTLQAKTKDRIAAGHRSMS